MVNKSQCRNIIRLSLFILIFSLPFIVLSNGHLPTKQYETEHLEHVLPSEKFYMNNLRSEWDEEPTGPGGEDEGGGGWVGAPIGDAGYSICFAISIYVLVVILRKRRVNNVNK